MEEMLLGEVAAVGPITSEQRVAKRRLRSKATLFCKLGMSDNLDPSVNDAAEHLEPDVEKEQDTADAQEPKADSLRKGKRGRSCQCVDTSSKLDMVLVGAVCFVIAALIAVLAYALSLLGKNEAVGMLAPMSQLNGSYRGVQLQQGVTQWLGIRYAAAPVGALRFAAPQDPPPLNGVVLADQITPGCMGTGPAYDNGISEDCLFLDIYAPTAANATSRLAVYVFIQGGGFDGDGSHYNGTGLIIASGMQLLVISLTYRGAALGLLASTEVQANASLNNALKDQRQALEWVQTYIAAFGGDPGRVTVGGQSAGAGSVVYHLAAYGGRNDNLFVAAIAQSQSLPPVRTIEQSQYQYDGLVQRAGCANASDTLACLRGLDIQDFQAANLNEPFPGGGGGNPVFPYNPVIDNDFVTDFPINSFESGRVVRVPTIFGDDTNEGTVFTPQGISDALQAYDFLQDTFPFLTPGQQANINLLYGFNVSASVSGPFWQRAASAYGELRYICPGIQLSSALANGSVDVPVYNYHFDVIDPTLAAQGLGVPHGAEQCAIWGPAYCYGPASYTTSNQNIVPLMQGYWSSFIVTSGDPNAKRAAGAPQWMPWTQSQMRLHILTNASAMESVPTLAQGPRCDYLASIALDLQQ